ncbi:hypothetical protein C8R42DRAFT_726467 [Lentinula raphanica]|nr:hypothetical protein C8R42DRAFT_726467 [Lentinula raphanica]
MPKASLSEPNEEVLNLNVLYLVWHVEFKSAEWLIQCKACRTAGQTPYCAKRHEDSQKHKDNVARRRGTNSEHVDDNVPPAVPISSIYDLAATRLLQSFSNTPSASEYLPPLSDFQLPHSKEPSPHISVLNAINWAELGMNEEELGTSHEVESRQALSSYMLDIFAHGPDNIHSDDELDTNISNSDHSQSADEDGTGFAPMRGDDAFDPANLIYKRPCTTASDKSLEWFPWPDRTVKQQFSLPVAYRMSVQACTLDILMHLPHSAFSVRQLELFLWLLKVNGVQDATSVKTMKDLDTKLQQLYGIQTFKYKGAFGHIYYVNSVADIISQEMCNPHVRPHLSFYPEDCGSKNVSEARQFDRWLNEIPDDQLGPMARIHATDYYIFEPAMLRDGSIYMPHRWFKRMGRLLGIGGISRDSRDGNIFPDVLSDYQNGNRFNITNPSMIKDLIDYTTTPPTICDWKLTNPEVGNSWRQHANGAQVLSYPIWLYCDDTSGNTSKRWNEHNSFLFTSAGLNRSESSKEYNVHFLSTSNTAPPLEMLDGIADQLQDCQENGIWAWDPLTESRVLLIVCVLALLGDNPMQSKDASADKEEAIAHESGSEEGGGDSDAGSVASKGGKKKRTKFKESLQTMVNRVKAFVKPGKPQKKSESIAALKTQFIEAQTPGAGNRIKAKRIPGPAGQVPVSTGQQQVTGQDVGGKIPAGQVTGAQPVTTPQDTLQGFPSETMSPVWRIRGLDPHSDTPVEILHVVLLGFIKYLWRDVIENQIKKNPEKKAELAACLSCINVDGLGLDSSLPGKTLVDYYGSLTGSDFRKISQVAPFVLKDFVSKDCFETWIALSKLVPLIWQPEIKDLESYIVTLEHEIEQFLLYAAKWSVRWFNKPKFHILVHLPAHIRRFGPAMLFATEVFESYNAIIRAKSIHSNRLAPSRDIALAFAKQNRIRHMLSGGLFLDRSCVAPNKQADQDFYNTQLSQQKRVTQVQQYFRLGACNKEDWVRVGKSVCDVISWSTDTVGKYLGIFEPPKPVAGFVTLDPAATKQHWSNTQSGRRVPETALFTSSDKSQAKFRQSKDVILVNGDRCTPLSYAACSAQACSPFACDGISIVQVLEILRIKRLGALSADSILVEAMIIGTEPSVHGMPCLKHSGKFFVVEPTVLQCTVNVQHNCYQNNCQVEQVRAILQERERTGEVRGAIVHRGDIHDVVLNTAQMRDAKFVQRFRLPGKILSFEQELTASATREWDALNKPRNTDIRQSSRSRMGTQGVPVSTSLNRSLPASPLTGTANSTRPSIHGLPLSSSLNRSTLASPLAGTATSSRTIPSTQGLPSSSSLNQSILPRLQALSSYHQAYTNRPVADAMAASYISPIQRQPLSRLPFSSYHMDPQAYNDCPVANAMNSLYIPPTQHQPLSHLPFSPYHVDPARTMDHHSHPQYSTHQFAATTPSQTDLHDHDPSVQSQVNRYTPPGHHILNDTPDMSRYTLP